MNRNFPFPCLLSPARRTLLLLAVLAISACGGGGGGPAPGTEIAVTAEQLFFNPNFMVGLAYTPEGDLLFTELQTGAVRIIPHGQSQPLAAPFAVLPVPNHQVAGLLGIAVDTEYQSNGFVYVYETVPTPLRNRVVRFRRSGNAGVEPFVLIDGIPSGGHDGGKFGSDREGHIYVGTGDAGDPALSQDLNSLAGKVLRLNRDGSIPSDNPFPGSPVYALGFRNVFGIDRFPGTDTLYVSENGPDCDDEIDRLVAGGNYGWRPAQPCGDADPLYQQPIHRITPSAGATGALFYQGNLFPELNGELLVAGYNAGEIRRLRIDEGQQGAVLAESILYPGGSGSVIDLAQSKDGEITFLTANALFRLVRQVPSGTPTASPAP